MIGAALVAFAAPVFANPSTYVEARIAAEDGAAERASRGFRALLAADPQSRLVAQRALDHGLMAADWPLALTAARRLDSLNALPPLRRLLLLGEALKSENWAVADRQIERIEQDRVFAMVVPILRAWHAFGSGRGDPLAALAPMSSGPGAGYAVEHRALIGLARAGGPTEPFAGLNPEAGLRPQRLRLVAAAELAARGQRDQALAMLAGDQPAFVAARALVSSGRPLPGRIDSAADGVAELLARIAIDFNQQEAGNEAVLLAQLARYMAPDSSEPVMLAAEIMGEARAPAAARLLQQVPPGDPFAQAARDLRLRLLASSGQGAAALAEVRARIGRGSRAPADFIQLGDLSMDASRYADAATAYRRALELWRAGTYPAIEEWMLHLSLGGALERSGDWPAARAALREAYRLAPTEPLVLNYLGYAQLERGEALEESERLIREALQRAHGNAAITDSLGWALHLRGRTDEAIPLLELATRDEPADVEINEHLGDAYFAAGRRIEARFAWAAALVYAEGDVAARLRGKIERGPQQSLAER